MEEKKKRWNNTKLRRKGKRRENEYGKDLGGKSGKRWKRNMRRNIWNNSQFFHSLSTA